MAWLNLAMNDLVMVQFADNRAERDCQIEKLGKTQSQRVRRSTSQWSLALVFEYYTALATTPNELDRLRNAGTIERTQ